MTEPPLSIERFPEAAAAAARTVVEGNLELAVASMDRVLRGGRGREIFLLRRADFEWQFNLARQGEHVVFFFVRRDSPVEVVLDATVSFSFEPLPPDSPRPPSGDTSYRWVVPPFMRWAVTPAEVGMWGPDGASAEDTIFLGLGPSGERVLAARFPGGRDLPQLAYAASGRKITFDARPGSWPLGAVLDVVAAMRAWSAADPERGTEVPFIASHAATSDVVRIVTALAEGWIAADQGGRISAGNREAGILVLALDYGIGHLSARVALRLGADGRLAMSHEADALQLALRVRVARRDPLVVATAAISPPDFLASGVLHEAFGTLVRSDTFAGPLRAALGNAQAPAADLAAFLGSATSRWVAFRVARRASHDTDVVVWQGAWGARPRLLVLRVDVVVEVGAAEPVRLASDPRLRARLLEVDVETIDMLEDEASYFARLLREIYRWRQLAA